jgi:mono/diheme cytochrome c family protein
MNYQRIAALALFGVAAAASFVLPVSQADPKAKTTTFNKDVAPIMFKSCAQCHRPGEAAPFSVLSYKEARPWAKSIREKVVNREMPPWHADPHVGQWANDSRLSQKEIETITAWVDGGANEGDAKDLPPTPQFTTGWAIGKPDVIIEMPEDCTVEASGPDEYQYFEVPTNFTEDKYVQMAEARPGNRKIVHHIIAFIVPPGQANMSKVPKEQRDKAMEMSLQNSPFYRDGKLIRLKKDQPVYNDGSEIPPGMGDSVDNFLAAYAPGSTYGFWKPGTAKKVPAGATIRFQVHYSKVAGTVQKDRSMVGMIFAKEPPQQVIRTRGASNIYFQIPAGAERHKASSVWTPLTDITVYSLLPHMHYRGVGIEFDVTYPNGKKEKILNVPNYSFAWQMSYDPKTPLYIPAGSKIEVIGYFDNSAKNKFNPDPTQTVRYGEPTYDEMLIGFLDYVPVKPKQLAKVDPQVFDTYVGKYDFGNNRVYTVTREGDRYFGQGPAAKRELFAGADSKFYLPEIEARVSFAKNAEGTLDMVFEQGDRTMRFKKLKE